MIGPHLKTPDDGELPALAIGEADSKQLTDVRPSTRGVACSPYLQAAATEVADPPDSCELPHLTSKHLTQLQQSACDLYRSILRITLAQANRGRPGPLIAQPPYGLQHQLTGKLAKNERHVTFSELPLETNQQLVGPPGSKTQLTDSASRIPPLRCAPGTEVYHVLGRPRYGRAKRQKRYAGIDEMDHGERSIQLQLIKTNAVVGNSTQKLSRHPGHVAHDQACVRADGFNEQA